MPRDLCSRAGGCIHLHGVFPCGASPSLCSQDIIKGYHNIWALHLRIFCALTALLKFGYLFNHHFFSTVTIEVTKVLRKGILNARKLANELWSHAGYHLCHLTYTWRWRPNLHVNEEMEVQNLEVVAWGSYC